jgi:hypothetical protein
MKKATWKNRIIESCRAAGTYRDFFLPVIDTLAGILEKRDEAQEMFKASGGNILVKHTNKGGATNIEQNPALRLINDLNRDALAYWRDLGLTPAGLKKIDEEAMKPKKRNTLDKVLMELA